MSTPASGLRLRLFSGVLGAGLLSGALLAIALLLDVRDVLYARRLADARESLQQSLHDARAQCGPAVAQACLDALLAQRSSQGLQRSESPCVAPMLRAGAMATLCEALPGGGGLRLTIPLEPVRDQLRALDERLLLSLAASLALSVLLSLALLERGVVQRLRVAISALESLEAPGEHALLPEGGDALGRLGGAVNRFGNRLTEERARTQAQIVSLQQSNHALADEQRALRETRADLSRSEQLASVGRLAAGVAHEVGNPISAVIAYAALLRERLARIGENPNVAEAQQFAERIEREAARVDRILRDLLDLARPAAPRLELIDLQGSLGAARALVEPQPMFRDCALQTELPSALPLVQGEPHYVVQVLVNLFTNAAKAGARKIRVRATIEPDAVSVEVSDDGSGIAHELLPRLFEPFVTGSAAGQGTGLGLALSHATMQRIGGSITARAGAPQGTVMVLRFHRGAA